MRYISFYYRDGQEEEAVRYDNFHLALDALAELLPAVPDRHGFELERGGRVSIDRYGITAIVISPKEWKEPFLSGFKNPTAIKSILIQREDVARIGERERAMEGNRPWRVTDAA